MIFPWFKLDPNERLAARILIREIGVFGALGLGRWIRKEAKRGRPFDEIEAADCKEERLSRAQIGPAILMYEGLRARVGKERALRITEEVVVEAACLFLRDSIGPLRRRDLERLDPKRREGFVRERGNRFFNATVEWDEISSKAVVFTVKHCRFPPLCERLGVSELAPLFCKGDAKYFGTVEPDVSLARPRTIAGGSSDCLFDLRWSEVGDDEDDERRSKE